MIEHEKRRTASQTGYTLVEVILTIVILSIISTFVGMFMFYDVNMYKHVKSTTQEVQESRMAVQRMSTELRQIASTDSISTATLTSIQFYFNAVRVLGRFGEDGFH